MYINSFVFSQKEEHIKQLKKIKYIKSLFGNTVRGQKKADYIRCTLRHVCCNVPKCRTCGKNYTKSKNKDKGSKQSYLKNIQKEINDCDY